jgi:hypothetical protein
LRSYSPGGTLNAFTSARKGSIPPTPSVHRLRPGLPGYLIPFAPLAFAPQRQWRASEPPSPPVFFLISTHSTATPGIPLTSLALKMGSFRCNLPVERRSFHTRLTQPPTRPLRPIIPNNACPLRITAAAGTELAGASSGSTVTRPPKRAYSSSLTVVYTPKGFIPHAASLGQGFPHCRSL